MSRHQVLACLGITMLLMGSAPANATLSCSAETIEATDFSLNSLDESLRAALGDSARVALLRYSATPKGRDMELTHQVDLVAAGLLDGVREKVGRTLAEASSESHELTAGVPMMSVNDAQLHIRIPITYTLKLWMKFDWICCHRLKCRKCYKREWTKVVQKTVDMRVAIVGRAQPALDLVAIEQPVDLRAGRTEERLLHGLGKIFPAIQAKLVSSGADVDDQIEALRLSKIRNDLPRLRGLSPNRSSEQTVISFERNLTPKSFSFTQHPTMGPVLSFMEAGPIDGEIYCTEVRPRLRETLAYLDSFRRTSVCETIGPGDSLYRLADKHYGNGNCHVALSQINTLRGLRVDQLNPGDQVLVPPMHQVLTSQDGAVSVRRGDSRWTIAQASGSPTSCVLNGEGHDSQTPDLIFPCQYVATECAASLASFVTSHDVCPK